VIIILTLPLDLFFQQIVSYPNVWVPTPTPATIPRSVTYTPSDGVSLRGGELFLEFDTALAQATQPFWYSNGTMPDLNMYCPTSNCTWDPFETLAVCGACQENLVSELEFGCHFGPAEWLTNVTDYVDGTSVFPNVTQCGYFLNASSDARRLMSGYALDPITGAPGEALTLRLFPLVDSETRESFYGGSLRFKEIVDPIIDFLVVGNPGGALDAYRNATPVAHECVLSWCTQTLQSSLNWGRLSENVSSTFQNETQRPFPWLLGQNPGDYTYTDDISLTPPDQHGRGNPDQATNLTFGLTNLTAVQTVFLTDTLLPAFVTAQNASAESMFKYTCLQLHPGPRIRTLAFNPWLETNVTDHIQRIAEAMSIVIRNTPAEDGSLIMIQGTAWDIRIHVSIRWVWIILPIALLLLSLFFLVATVMKSSKERQEVGIWKTSAIAILFNGLGDDVQKTVGLNCGMGQARAKARELNVKLMQE
jgi:hypothetical protein